MFDDLKGKAVIVTGYVTGQVIEVNGGQLMA